MEENKRIKFEIKNIDKFMNGSMIIYYIQTKNEEDLIFETKSQYIEEYDKKFYKNKKLSGLVEFVNPFNNKILITNIRFLKCI